MKYCTVEDIKAHWNERAVASHSNDDSNSKEANNGLVELLIGTSSRLIDDYVSKQYQLPLKSNHEILRNACVELVIFKLRYRRDLVFDKLEQRDNVLKQLLDIAEGRVTLDGEEVKGLVRFRNRERVFK